MIKQGYAVVQTVADELIFFFGPDEDAEKTFIDPLVQLLIEHDRKLDK